MQGAKAAVNKKLAQLAWLQSDTVSGHRLALCSLNEWLLAGEDGATTRQGQL